MADPQVNFFSSTLVGGYSDSDTELTLATGSGANLPDPSVDGEFNLVIYNESEIFVTTTFDGGSTDTRQDLASTNPEIVRVTARSGDVITVTRAQEGTTASAKASENTYRVILASTKKVFDDINDAIANVDLTTLTGVEELTFDSTGDEEFGLPAGTTAQRPSSPSAGYMRYNTETAKLEIYSGGVWGLVSLENVRVMQTAQLSVTANDAVFEEPTVEVEYLVIAGGGGGGNSEGASSDSSGGGGAGGYRSSVSGESSGGGASAESALELDLSTNYTVTVGAGGSGGSIYSGGTSAQGSNGSNSVFNTITSTGGGGGAGQDSNAQSGGSGGGGGNVGINSDGDGGTGTAGQGFGGGTTTTDPGGGSGGGGAGQAGDSAGSSLDGQDGGDGVQSSITGTTVYRAGGGGGGTHNGGSGFGGGGQGGGGNGSGSGNSTADSGGSNTGGGGGGGDDTDGTGSGNGGSGVVILRYPSNFTITIGAGLTGSETTDGSEKYAEITAGTGNVSWTRA